MNANRKISHVNQRKRLMNQHKHKVSARRQAQFIQENLTSVNPST